MQSLGKKIDWTWFSNSYLCEWSVTASVLYGYQGAKVNLKIKEIDKYLAGGKNSSSQWTLGNQQ